MLFALLSLFFVRANRPQLSDNFSPAEHDTLQATRYFAQTNRLGTNIIRPLLSDRVPANADGTLPDMAHPPLPIVLGAAVFRVSNQISLVAFVAFLLSTGACVWFTRQLFGAGVAPLSVAFYVLAVPSGLHFAAYPSPIALGTLLLTLLFIALHKLDATPQAGETEAKNPLWIAGLAGGLCGLLFLTIYSTLVLLPLLLAYLWRVGGREKAAVCVAFVSVWLLVGGPYFVRNTRLTRSPIYNSRLFELTMHLPNAGVYEGANLYHEADLPQTTARFVARGGAAQILRKAGANFAALVAASPVQFGVFVLPLFLGAALSRFPDARTDRLRNFAYCAILWHGVGLSFFLPVEESAAVLRMYAPLAAGFAAAFLLAVVRARNLPAFYARAAVWGWGSLACFGGALALLGVSSVPNSPPIPAAFYALNNGSPEMRSLKQNRVAFLLASQPECAADILNVSVALLPPNSRSFQALQIRLNKTAGGVVLTPALSGAPSETTPPSLAPWADLYGQINALRQVTTGLDAKTRQNVIQQKQVFYPAAIRAAMRDFPRPVPVNEPAGKTSLIFWNVPSPSSVQNTGSNQEP